ncbi:Uncharacterised protein [Vibrio cholerae]|nr:Uncharacterised protein [Vibrio cholerae]
MIGCVAQPAKPIPTPSTEKKGHHFCELTQQTRQPN